MTVGNSALCEESRLNDVRIGLDEHRFEVL